MDAVRPIFVSSSLITEFEAKDSIHPTPKTAQKPEFELEIKLSPYSGILSYKSLFFKDQVEKLTLSQ